MNSGVDTVIEIKTENEDKKLIEEVYRNLKILYGTRAGEQALDRDFGIDGDVTDYPFSDAEARLAAEYVKKTQKYEPRAQVSELEWLESEPIDGKIRLKVVIELV